MAEDLQNPDNVQAAAGNPAADGEEYEYEYIELAEGEELPEDAEYEYVEVSDDEMPSMIPPSAAVSTPDVSEPEVSTPEPIIPSAAETVTVPVSSAPVQPVDAVVPQAAVSQPAAVPPVEEADLNALLDNDGEIEEVDASTLLDGDYSDDFARNLFADKPSEKIEEVSIDDILGEDAAAVPAGIGDVREVSALENWHLIIFNQNLVPAEAGGVIEIVQPQDTIRAATVVKQGTEKLEIYNEEEYRFADPADGFVPARKHFIYGRTGDDTGLIVNDFVNIGLRENSGKVITFENPVFGWLSGPNGAQIYFAQLGRLAVSSPEQAAGDDEKAGQHAAKWYSGNLEDRYFEFSGAAQSGEFTGSDEVKNIHVNVGTSAYGWNVSFDNGLVMSMRDLQEFESKHGKMPSPNGEISHGALKLKFSNVERIVAYQTPQYFAYGRR